MIILNITISNFTFAFFADIIVKENKLVFDVSLVKCVLTYGLIN